MALFRFAGAMLLCVLSFGGAVFSADLDALPNPLTSMRVGQWVRYRHVSFLMEVEETRTVVGMDGEGDERVIRIESVTTMDGEVVDERVESATYAQALAEQRRSLEDAVDAAVQPVELEIKGATVDGVRVDFTQDGSRYSLYMSERIPVTGVLRMEVEGEEGPVLELLDFGEYQ